MKSKNLHVGQLATAAVAQAVHRRRRGAKGPPPSYRLPVTARLRPWIPALAWSALLFGLSTIPGSAIPEVPTPNVDKLVHGALYLVLGLCCARGLGASARLAPVPLVMAATAMATAFGVTDELHQLLTPRRSADWLDVVADAIGALLGALVATGLRRRARQTSQQT
jgi:VanZ family protein